jgi:hypothetical protein
MAGVALVSGAYTVYCSTCERPVLLIRRGKTTPTAGVVVLDVDGEGVVRAMCPCGEVWRRESVEARA